jgi:hypothetical protein
MPQRRRARVSPGPRPRRPAVRPTPPVPCVLEDAPPAPGASVGGRGRPEGHGEGGGPLPGPRRARAARAGAARGAGGAGRARSARGLLARLSCHVRRTAAWRGKRPAGDAHEAEAPPRSVPVAPRSWMSAQVPGVRSPGTADLAIRGGGLRDGTWRWPGAVGQASTDRREALLPGAGGTPGPRTSAGPCLGERKRDGCREPSIVYSY